MCWTRKNATEPHPPILYFISRYQATWLKSRYWIVTWGDLAILRIYLAWEGWMFHGRNWDLKWPGRGVCVCVNGEACLVCSQVSLSPGAMGQQKTRLLKMAFWAVPTLVLCPISPSSMSYTSLFLLPILSVPTAVTPSPIAGHSGEKHKSWSVYPCCGTLWQLVTSNLKSLMTIQLEFLPL